MSFNSKNKTERRLFVIFLGKIFVFILLIIRLYRLQIKNHHKYSNISIKNSTAVTVEPPMRGRILDCNNNPLALNKNNYNIVAYNTKETMNSINTLIEMLKLREEEGERIKKILAKQPMPVIIMPNVNWELFYKIEINAHKLPGIRTFIKKTRFYPYGNQISHVVGYAVSQNNNSRVDKNNAVHNILIGKTGIEQYFNDDLSGKPGFISRMVNAYGVNIKNISHSPAQKGSDIQLSINIRAQQEAQKIMAGYNGSLLVLDLENGHMVVAYNNPSFDPNYFSKGIDHDTWRKLRDDKSFPLMNRFVSNPIPPGSLFKLITAIAALKYGIVDVSNTINCSGSVVVGNRVARCWNRIGHGDVNLVKAIATSCNSYFYEIGRTISIDLLLDVARILGLGEPTNIECGTENRGILPNLEWRSKYLSNKWFTGDTVNSVIGQGYVLATPIQLITMVARVATGLKIYPTFMKNNKQTFSKLAINEQNLFFIRKGMFDSVNAPYGTSFSKENDLNIQIAGKTGTSQTISNKGKESTGKTHSLFAGYAPFTKPKIAILAFIEKGGQGTKVAAPKVKQMFKALQDLGYFQT